METLRSCWLWLIQHWKALGITVPTTVGAISWAYSTYMAHRQKRLDARVFDTLSNRALWTGQRPFTGAGELLVRASEIADALALTLHVVADSLERLKAQGKVQKFDGTLSNPAPYWIVVRR